MGCRRVRFGPDRRLACAARAARRARRHRQCRPAVGLGFGDRRIDVDSRRARTQFGIGQCRHGRQPVVRIPGGRKGFPGSAAGTRNRPRLARPAGCGGAAAAAPASRRTRRGIIRMVAEAATGSRAARRDRGVVGTRPRFRGRDAHRPVGPDHPAAGHRRVGQRAARLAAGCGPGG